MSASSAPQMILADSPKSSFESNRLAGQHDSVLKRAAKKIAKAAKEHHNSVNAAFDAVYGPRSYAPTERAQLK